MKFEFEAEVSYHCDGEIEADNRQNAVEKFEEESADSMNLRIISINGVEVIGRCENCRHHILEGEDRGPYSDIDMCKNCTKDDDGFGVGVDAG